MTAQPPPAPARAGAPPTPPSGLSLLPCAGGPLHGELREAGVEHVLWCLVSGGAPGRPMTVLLHRSVLDLPRVVETVTDAPDALGHYVLDAARRVLRWIAREAPGGA